MIKMADVAITRMSSKGQVVIPAEMRRDFKEGEQFIVIRNGKQLILKRAKDFGENLKDDLVFAKRTEEAWKRYERGELKSMNAKDFLKELEKW